MKQIASAMRRIKTASSEELGDSTFHDFVDGVITSFQIRPPNLKLDQRYSDGIQDVPFVRTVAGYSGPISGK